MSQDLLDTYQWRPLRYDDLPALHALFVAVAEADKHDRVDTLADLQTQFDEPWSNPQTDSRIALAPDGTLAAFARCFMNPQPEREASVHLWPEVHPAHRGRGLEDALLDWLIARACERLAPRDAGGQAGAPASLPRDMRLGLTDTLTESIARVEARGFKPLRYFYRMRRDLRAPIPAPQWPEGITVRTYTPDLSGALLAAHNEAFSDHWGYDLITPDEWQQFFIGTENFRPEFTLVAFDQDQIAAYSLNRVHAQDNARRGVNEGHIGQLGTRRGWRKRGLASALLCESMCLFRAAGFDHATLGVDAENPTGALGLYERLGFVAVKRFIVFSKTVDGGA